MDIPDIELVVVNGPPATLAQLYQVIDSLLLITFLLVFCYYLLFTYLYVDVW